jgi:hypothetical protein
MISLFESGIPGGLKGWTIPLIFLLSSCLTDFLQAQAPPREPPGAPAQIAPQQLAPEELNRLLAPIALEHQAYRDIPVDEQVEMISLIGDVGLVNGKPQVHTHGAVGLPDGDVRGGHLLEAIVFPTLEVFLPHCPPRSSRNGMTKPHFPSLT